MSASFRGARLGEEDLPGGDALANLDAHPPGWPIPNTPAPHPGTPRGAPRKACYPEAPAWARMTCCATAVRRVSEMSTTSAHHSASVCQCKRRDVTLAYATRIGPQVEVQVHVAQQQKGGG